MEKLILESLGAAGIGGVLILLPVIIGRSWLLTRLKNSIKYEYDLALKKYEAGAESALAEVNAQFNMTLEIAKLKLAPYSEHQFNTYNDLWSHLCSLRRSMEILWQVALTPETFDDFAAKLDAASAKLEESALLIEPQHYEELWLILETFITFKMGNQTVLEIWHNMQAGKPLDDYRVRELVDGNGDTRNRLNAYLPQMRLCLQSQLLAGKA